MNQLTTPITIPNIQKMHVAAVQLDSDNLVANVTVVVQGGGGIVYNTYPLVVRDGNSQGIRATAAPLGYADRCELFIASTPSGFTSLVAAYTGTIAARNSATETALIAAGLMPPGVVT